MLENDQIRLTEEEIVAEASKDATYCQLSVDVGIWAAREQVKHLYSWGNEPCPHWEGFGYKLLKHQCPKCWESLKGDSQEEG